MFGVVSPSLAIQTIQMIGNILVTNANARRRDDSRRLSDDPPKDMSP